MIGILHKPYFYVYKLVHIIYVGADEVDSSHWFVYETFWFLKDRDRSRQGLNTVSYIIINTISKIPLPVTDFIPVNVKL